MSDIWEILREKKLGGRSKIIEMQVKALESPYVYRIFCYYNNLLLAKFVVWGIKEKELYNLMLKNFTYFHINSEGSGEFYFKKRLVELLDEIGGWNEPLEIMDNSDVPITSFKLEKLKPMSERTED